MRYLWAGWDELKGRVTPQKKKLVFLDFDGTLVSIADTPEAVKLDPRTLEVLQKLSQESGVRLVILSGRPLSELTRRLKLKNTIMAGNHGLEIQGRGADLPVNAKKARSLSRFIHLLSEKFKVTLSHYPGVWVEDKQYTLSIHYRALPRGQAGFFDEMIAFFKKKYEKYPILWTWGKKVVEVRPSIYWGKGDIVMHLLKKFKDTLPIGIGDDKADEDMFKVLKERGGIAVRVGYSASSAADYYLSSPYDVKVFLQKLCR
jgi:trehalose 6-phosphate phosphatase